MTKKLFLFFFLLQLSIGVKAQVPISIYRQFAGKYDFTMIGNTMNEEENGPNPNSPFDPLYCDFLTQTSATLNLAPGQRIEAAFLYWAGSGTLAQADLDIKLNGVPVVVDRTFTTNISNRGVFGAFSDVTAQVQATGNGTYTVSDFDLSSIISPYCPTGGNFGGWSILVIYEDLSLTNNLVNVYDGFVRVDSSNQNVTIQLTNLNVLNLTGNKIGFLAWEGDSHIAISEEVRINGNLVSNPPLNPATNVFNGTNSFTNSSTLYNMDMDFFDINNYTNIGDSSLTFQLRSGQDAVIINNMVVVLNTEVPDATIVLDNTRLICDERKIEVDYTVFNLNSTLFLPRGTPIAFYANNTLVDTSATINDIPIDGSESNSIILTIPNTIPDDFTLRVKVDDVGTGNGIVIEVSEDNNTAEVEVSMLLLPDVRDANLSKCVAGDQFTFDLTESYPQINPTGENLTISFHLSQQDAEDDVNPLPLNYTTNSDVTLWVRAKNVEGCHLVVKLDLVMLTVPEISIEEPEEICTGSTTILRVTADVGSNVYWYDSQDATVPIFVGDTFPTPVLTADTSYWVEIEGVNGCKSERIEVVVRVSALNEIAFNSLGPYCFREGFTLPNVDLNGITGHWTPAINIEQTTTYTFHPDDGQCAAEGYQMVVEILPLPELHYINQQDICLGEEITLTVTTTGEIVNWYESETSLTPFFTGNEYTVSPTGTTTYWIEGAIGSCVSEKFPITVKVYPVMELEEFEDLMICPGDIYEFIAPGGYDFYIWKDQSGNVISNEARIEFTDEGTYTLTASLNGAPCTVSEDIKVSFLPTPIISEVEASGSNLTVYVSGSGIFEYSLNETFWQSSNVFYNLEPGIYYVYVRQKDGCGISVKKGGILGASNFISPNGDGYNDTWKVRGLEAYPNSRIQIFDRYGKIFVDQTLNSSYEWNGKYRGEPLPSGTYWYIVTLPNGEKLTGNILLKNY